MLKLQQQRFPSALEKVEEVITAQRNLALAESQFSKARAGFARTLIQYEEATGTRLERNNIQMSEAVDDSQR